MKKFNKNRSVDSRWLNIPVKYMLNVKGSNTGSGAKNVPLTIQESYERYLESCKEFSWLINEPIMSFDEYKKYDEYNRKHNKENYEIYKETKWVPAKHDKTFCIVEISKNWATCGWRNNETGSIGMPIKCRIVKKGKNVGIIYKDKFFKINDSSGWVL